MTTLAQERLNHAVYTEYTGCIQGGEADLIRYWYPGDMIRVNGMMRRDQANEGNGKAAAGGCCSY
jgi:hypothetical protein